MPPKKATKAAAPAKPKANTGAKVTKPAPAATTSTATTKRVAAMKAKEPVEAPAKAPPAKKAAPKKAAAPKKTATSAATAKSTATAKKSKAEETKPVPPKAKAAPKRTAAPKKTTPIPTTKTTAKRKAEDETPAPAPAKKAKVVAKGKVINEPPTDRLHVFVFGEGTAGELGLGTAKNAVDVKRPRLNANLAADKVGVVQMAAGGMHVVALTHDNRIITWGVNDSKALGRNTDWEGGLKDLDEAAKEGSDEDSDDEEDDNGLNPHESTPGEVDWSGSNLPQDTRFTAVAAGDSISLALTDDGKVYGWGSFRSNEGPFGFSDGIEVAERPTLIPDLKNIISIKCGANHALALSATGQVFAWGSGQQNQLGRRVVERTKTDGLRPREFGLPKGPKNGMKSIETGSYHNFAISKNGNVYSWGLNSFGQTGVIEGAGQDEATVLKPQVIEGLRGKNVTSIKGGSHHSIAAVENGDCLVWGRCDTAQAGIPMDDIKKMGEDEIVEGARGPAIIRQPTKIPAIQGKVTFVTANSDQNIVVTEEGKAYSWGFSANYQTGLGTDDDVPVATLIENTAVRERKLNGASSGAQFGIVTANANA